MASMRVANSLKLASKRARLSTRNYSSSVADAAPSEYAAKREATKAHAAHTSGMWKKASFFICVPGAIVGGIYVKKVEDEHHAHMEHEKHEHGDEPKPEYIYLNRRIKPFPWGPNSLFFNPEVNKDMAEAA